VKPVKGYVHFVRAAARLRQRIPDVTFLVIGEDEEGHQRSIEAETEALGIRDRFRFLGFRSDVADVIRSLHLFVLTSLSEGHPLATVEAMGAGTPIVVSRIGGHEEIVEDGATGYLVRPEDDVEVAARTRFGVQAMITGYEDLYRECLRRG
jgi:glycosyltransferase involved in cell wall biosynthesis